MWRSSHAFWLVLKNFTMLRRWLSPHEVDQQIVLVIYSAVEDRCGSLLAVAVVWSLVLLKGGRTVVFQFLETFVAGLWVPFAEVLPWQKAVVMYTFVALAVVVWSSLVVVEVTVLAFLFVQCAVAVFCAVLHPIQQIAASHLKFKWSN